MILKLKLQKSIMSDLSIKETESFVYVTDKTNGYLTGRVTDVTSEHLEIELFPTSNQKNYKVSIPLRK